MSDDLKPNPIEQAARTMRNRWSMQTPPTDDDYTNARALARDGLLVDLYDVELRRDVVRWRQQLEAAEAERDALQARIDAALALTEPDPLRHPAQDQVVRAALLGMTWAEYSGETEPPAGYSGTELRDLEEAADAADWRPSTDEVIAGD